MICEITKELKKIEVNDDKDGYPENAFKILYPYADEYIRLQYKYGLSPEHFKFNSDKNDKNKIPKTILELEDRIDKLSKHPIIFWLNKQCGMIDAKRRVTGSNLVMFSDPGADVLKQYRNNIALEFVCIRTIVDFANNKFLLEQIVTSQQDKKKIYNLLRKLKNELNSGIFLKVESKQQLLQWLIKDILENDILENASRNVYSSGKTHPFQLRELLIKEIIKALFVIYGKHTHDGLVTLIALDLVSIFFNVRMDKGDANNLAKQILQNLIDNEVFRQQNIDVILAKEGLSMMKF